ncbi:MAG TPA: hypothetical protein DHN33_03035 [Eubacteriaceae bacterium]|nr:hypothetical protein [Eubacteriaceae bacterium]
MLLNQMLLPKGATSLLRENMVHELCHTQYHVHNHFTSDKVIIAKNEAQAKAFAAYFLMPVYIFEEALKYCENEEELAEEFGVTFAFMRYRKMLTQSLLQAGYFRKEVITHEGSYIYARFSSDNQREESIDAQIRAAKYYADQYGFEIVKIYADKAKSGRSTDRPEFMRMIQESSSGIFQAVLVHKLDRFSRDSADSLYFERLLNQNGVELISINEKLDDSPEGALMKMVITGMNEFYSKNLAREVMKGLKENAYNCKHTGGLTPLGYDLDAEKNISSTK